MLARVTPHGTITETVSPVWVSVRRNCTGRRHPPLASAIFRVTPRTPAQTGSASAAEVAIVRKCP
jgi:hypothetical protein